MLIVEDNLQNWVSNNKNAEITYYQCTVDCGWAHSLTIKYKVNVWEITKIKVHIYNSGWFGA